MTRHLPHPCDLDSFMHRSRQDIDVRNCYYSVRRRSRGDRAQHHQQRETRNKKRTSAGAMEAAAPPPGAETSSQSPLLLLSQPPPAQLPVSSLVAPGSAMIVCLQQSCKLWCAVCSFVLDAFVIRRASQPETPAGVLGKAKKKTKEVLVDSY